MPDSYIAPTLSGPSQAGGPDWNQAVQTARGNSTQPSALQNYFDMLNGGYAAGGGGTGGSIGAGGFDPGYSTALGSFAGDFMSGAGGAGRWGGDMGGSVGPMIQIGGNGYWPS